MLCGESKRIKELPRVLVLMIDQLSGHWVDGVKIKATGFPPPNIEDYHQLGFIPNISDCIQNGIWVRHPWNRGICETRYVSRYIVSGTYADEGGEHIISAIKTIFPGMKTASFSNWEWDVFDPQYNIGPENFDFNYTLYKWLSEKLGMECSKGLPPPAEYWEERRKRKRAGWKERKIQFSDCNLLHQYVIPWMRENKDWKVVYMHWVDHDGTHCPAFVETPKDPYDDKHHHLTDYVDKNVGELVRFLKSEGFWEEMYLIIFSDHGYHLNCDAPEAQQYGQDFCSDHALPHDCFVWDYQRNRSTQVRSDCCRRIFMLITGGALTPNLRGQQMRESEIIDIPSTVAHIYGIEYSGEGQSILER